MNGELMHGIRFFTQEQDILSALSVACGAGDHIERALDGDCRESSVFDLASVTKLFTGLCMMKLKEDGLLDFSRPVLVYDRRFERLGDITPEQLMAFGVTVKTPARLDACQDREEALAALLAAEAGERPQRRVYSDIPAMILKYVIEAAAGMPFYEYVKKVILEPAGMTETWAKVPGERIGDCQDYNREHRIEGTRRILRTDGKPGVPHDPKAAMLQGDTGDLCGHAGLFSTMDDMIRFCRAILAGKIVSADSLKEMAVNRTGKLLADGTHSQYLGYQCYVRHPEQYWSEIPVYMGKEAFGIGGFTGNHVSVDPARGLFTVFLGNRVKNRLTVVVPEAGKELADYGLNPDGTGKIIWDDGEEIASSVKYVHQKDKHLHSAVMQALGVSAVSCQW